MVLNIVADDFGISFERNKGIIETLEKGIVTHISLMTNCDKSSIDAVELFKNGGYNNNIIGLHLNLTEGLSLYDKKRLYGKMGIREVIEGIDTNIIKREIIAQIEWFIENLGFIPSFLNGHQHVQTIPIIADILIKILKQYKISYIRIPHELDIDIMDSIDKLNNFTEINREDKLCKVCSSINNNSIKYKEIYKENGIKTNTYFIGLTFCNRLYTLGNMIDYLKFCNGIKSDKVKEIDEEIYEIMVHPGYSEVSGNGWDSFSESVDRETEIKILCDPKLIRIN
jgi:predicted glycoside hydrolase/deacetylase ChbG (UPF0249 family)